jgi:hypothetical protein
LQLKRTQNPLVRRSRLAGNQLLIFIANLSVATATETRLQRTISLNVITSGSKRKADHYHNHVVDYKERGDSWMKKDIPTKK